MSKRLDLGAKHSRRQNPDNSLRQLSELQRLHQQLKQQAAAEAEAQAKAKEAAAQLAREANLFHDSMHDVTPLKSANRANTTLPKPLPIAHQHRQDEAEALRESVSDEMDVERLLDTDAQLSFRRNGIGMDTLRKLRRGHWTIQAQLDLHGLRRDEARTQLGHFLRTCVQRNLRCVRIIHGKGHGSVNKEPILKEKTRTWLVQKNEVLAFCQAKAADGGSGALVVLLRGAQDAIR